MKFIQGLDYGPRKGTDAFVVHMTEGSGGLGDATYLAQRPGETRTQWINRIRGVSANFVILASGEVIQMVDWGHASGSMAPGLQGPLTGFYNRGHLHDVFGDHWGDPNAYAISVEIGGKRADGPTQAQVTSLVQLVAEARQRYPKMRGALGHADQTSTKGCPGQARLMLEAWRQLGHGLFPTEEPVKSYSCPEFTDTVVTIPDKTWLYVYSDFRADPGNVQLSPGRDLPYLGKPDGVAAVAYDRSPDIPGASALFIKGDVTTKPVTPPPPPDCTAAVAAEYARVTAGTKVTFPPKP